VPRNPNKTIPRVSKPKHSDGPGASGHSRGGRPRNPCHDRVILNEATRLLARHGMRGFTISEVAAAAGVGKTTIYRRWPTRDALVIAAVAQIAERFPAPDLGSIKDDLTTYLGGVAIEMGKPRNRRLHADLLQAAAHSSSFASSYQQLIGPRREMVKTILRRGVERGELRADCDLDLALDLLVGPLTQPQLVTGGALTAPFIDSLIDAALHGLQPG